jgi:hypothetical protein
LKFKLAPHIALIASLFIGTQIADAQTINVEYSTRVLITHNDTITGAFVDSPDLLGGQCDTLAQAAFWKKVMSLPPDSGVLNIAATREILDVIPMRVWRSKSDSWKRSFKDSVRSGLGLVADTKIYLTSGRSHFYRIDKTLNNINGALPVFDSMGTDPWYAQTILLIESPSSFNTSSSVGAHGPFQLMKSVATKRGLKVTSTIDEREDLQLAAGAACKLIKKICIPETRRMLARNGITEYNETDLWFRLLVMHSYHAGAGNVRGAIDKVAPDSVGMHIITSLWHTEYKGFKNASQNYSQVALAALLNLEEYLNSQDTFYILEGDRRFESYPDSLLMNSSDGFARLDSCIDLYEGDLMEQRTSFSSFLTRVRLIEAQKQLIADAQPTDEMVTFKQYPSSQKDLNEMGYKMLRSRRFVDAIAAFQLNVDLHAKSWNAHDSLGEAFMKSGNKTKAIEHYEESLKLNPKNSTGKAKLAKLKS